MNGNEQHIIREMSSVTTIRVPVQKATRGYRTEDDKRILELQDVATTAFTNDMYPELDMEDRLNLQLFALGDKCSLPLIYEALSRIIDLKVDDYELLSAYAID
jgi:hypothetical protein